MTRETVSFSSEPLGIHLKLHSAFFPECFEPVHKHKVPSRKFRPRAVFAHESAIHASPAALLRYGPFTDAECHYVARCVRKIKKRVRANKRVERLFFLVKNIFISVFPLGTTMNLFIIITRTIGCFDEEKQEESRGKIYICVYTRESSAEGLENKRKESESETV